MKQIDELIVTYLNDEASDSEVETLFDWVRQRPENAAAFARACALHADLREQFHGQQSISEAGFPPVAFASRRSGKQQGHTKWERRLAAVNQFLVAAVLLMVLQMSWGALTLLELCRSSAANTTVQMERSLDEFPD